jgi:protein O-GlcNAc transferase
MEPLLPIKEKQLFYKYLNNARYYLEYGSGGSTYQASIRPNITKVVSVESDKSWYDTINKIIKNKLRYYFVDLNALPNTFGYPVNASPAMMEYYPSIIKRYKKNQFDLILIDGRFRVACALICYDYIDNNCKVIVDDIGNRPHYNEIYNYYDKIDGVGRMFVFKKKQNRVKNSPSDELIKKYINDPR